GSRLLGLLGSGRGRDLLRGYGHETRNRLFQQHDSSHRTTLRSGEPSSKGSTGTGDLSGQKDRPLLTTGCLKPGHHSCGELPLTEPLRQILITSFAEM